VLQVEKSYLSWGMLGAFTHLVNCPAICCYCTTDPGRKIEFILYNCPVKKSSEELVNTGEYGEGPGTLSKICPTKKYDCLMFCSSRTILRYMYRTSTNHDLFQN
jgi:hypothetical protein